MKHLMRILIAALGAAPLAGATHGADAVKIGVIYPLTGNAASAGNSAKDAVDLGAEIVNGMHPEFKGSGLAGADGLPNLGGAKLELINADHQGNPQVGQSQTLRLIQQEKVAAMLGAYHSSVAVAATAVAERYGVPFLVADSVALNITQRGFKWVFRSGPIAPLVHHALGDVADRRDEGWVGESGIVADDDRRQVVEALQRLHVQDGVRRIADEDDSVGLLVLE